jgi:hypothetical protein
MSEPLLTIQTAQEAEEKNYKNIHFFIFAAWSAFIIGTTIWFCCNKNQYCTNIKIINFGKLLTILGASLLLSILSIYFLFTTIKKCLIIK